MAEAGETCDTGAASTTCDGDCSAAECGDGAVNAEASESCDDGVLNGTPSHCNSACSGETPATCGNGETEAGEACDTSGATATCDADCTEVTCGDSTKNTAANEACDEGPLNGSPNHCDATCVGTTAPSCGNSAVEAGEDCDTAAASTSCDADCSAVICGDGVQNAEAGESCDDGAQNGQPGACTSASDGQVPEPCPGGAGCDTCAATGVCGDDLGSDDLGSDDLGSDAGPTHDAGADLGPDPLGEVSGSSFFCGAARGTESGTPWGIGLALSLALLWRRRRSASPSSPRHA